MSKMQDKEYVKEQYSNDDKLSFRKQFHEIYSTSPISYHDWIFNNLQIEEGAKILDVGCGKGDFWSQRLHLLPPCELTVSDFSDHMVRLMKERFASKNIKVEQLDVTSLPYDDNSFDIVVATSMLYHVPDPSEALREISRVLKSGGKLYASTYSLKGFPEVIFHSLKLIDEQKEQYDVSFSLDNGPEQLTPFFSKITTHRFPDSLKITAIDDMVKFVHSMTSSPTISLKNTQILLEHFNQLKGDNLTLNIPKNYGTLMAQK